MSRMATSVLVLFALAASAPAAEFPLETKAMTADEAFGCPGLSVSYTGIMSTKPSGVKNEPPAKSPRPLYASVGKTVFRFDSSAANALYDRLIVDCNGNGDLRDDPVQEPQRAGQSTRPNMFRYGPIEVLGTGRDAKPMTVYIDNTYFYPWAQTTGYRGSVGRFQIFPANRLETVVEVNGVKERIAFVDGNRNLQIGDLTRGAGDYLMLAGDTVLRDCDGSGDFASDVAACEYEPLASYIYFGAMPCTIELSPDQKSVRVEPYKGSAGEIRCAKNDRARTCTLARRLDGGQWEALAPHAADGAARVPEGEYAVYSCMLVAKDGQGVTYSAQGTKNSIGPVVRVKDGASVALPFGAPIQMKVNATRQSSGGILGLFAASTVRIGVEIVGAGGETYRQFRKGQEIINPPRFRVVDEKGNELAAGQLEYG